MKLVLITTILFASVCIADNTPVTLPLINGFDIETVHSAVKYIVSKVNHEPVESVAVITSKGKEDFAEWIIRELDTQEIKARILQFSDTTEMNIAEIKSCFSEENNSQGLIILSDVENAQFLFQNVGHPVAGLTISAKHYYWDLLMPLPGLIRLMSADQDELIDFREALLSKIIGAKKIHITTENGTDIHVEPRSWITSDGEIYTALKEQHSQGAVFVDGSAYSGPPKNPFLLRVENGRVIYLSEMDTTDRQQRFVQNDLTADENANVCAELGIGTSINSKWDSQMMESEQARGTVHFGFGSNAMFEGGQNESSQHTDYIIRKPTIVVDGKIICEDGVFQLR